VAAGFAAAMLAGVLVALAARSLGEWERGHGWERALMLAVNGVDHGTAFDWVMLTLPWLGTHWSLLPIMIVLVLWLLLVRRRLDLALHLAVVEAGAMAMNPLTKWIFQRPRPELWELRGQFAWSSYPSGHAIASVAILFTLAILLRRERGWRWPPWLAAALAIPILYSRVYLGVHWPTDVIGGTLMGAVWLAATLRAFAIPARAPAAGGLTAPRAPASIPSRGDFPDLTGRAPGRPG
jgi:undecaprenyl-diphosphatase